MRLKRDSSNYNASNVKRKLAQPPASVRHKSKKNTRLWCKGKVGVEHDLQLTRYLRIRWMRHSESILLYWKCAGCGKKYLDSINRQR